jgi:hypothetical protein
MDRNVRCQSDPLCGGRPAAGRSHRADRRRGACTWTTVWSCCSAALKVIQLANMWPLRRHQGEGHLAGVQHEHAGGQH